MMPERWLQDQKCKEKVAIPSIYASRKASGGQDAKALAKYPHLILLCGHYEGVDERAIEKEVDEEISIGSYVLTMAA